MLEVPYRLSPLGSRQGESFALSRAGIEIAETGFLGKIQIRGTGERFRAIASELFGLSSMSQPLRSAISGDLAVLGLGPDEWMVISPLDRRRELLPKLDAALADTDAMAVDVSSAFATLRLSGAGSAALLKKGCSAPLERLTAGDCLRTRIGRYHILVQCTAGAPVLDLHVARSYARSFRNWIMDAASL